MFSIQWRIVFPPWCSDKIFLLSCVEAKSVSLSSTIYKIKTSRKFALGKQLRLKMAHIFFKGGNNLNLKKNLMGYVNKLTLEAWCQLRGSLLIVEYFNTNKSSVHVVICITKLTSFLKSPKDARRICTKNNWTHVALITYINFGYGRNLDKEINWQKNIRLNCNQDEIGRMAKCLKSERRRLMFYVD